MLIRTIQSINSCKLVDWLSKQGHSHRVLHIQDLDCVAVLAHQCLCWAPAGIKVLVFPQHKGGPNLVEGYLLQDLEVKTLCVNQQHLQTTGQLSAVRDGQHMQTSA